MKTKMTNNYYQKRKENLEIEAPERYQNLSEKDVRRKKARERYQDLTEEEKEKKA